MEFEARAFQLAKDPDCPNENQDAYRVDASLGVAAIGDGVASSIFSGRWARILVDAVVRDGPDPNSEDKFNGWLAEQRRLWRETFDVDSLAWFQKPKLRQGAFSTLLWMRLLEPEPTDAEAEQAGCRLQVFAIGDSCLFCVRGDQVTKTFPIQQAAELDADPLAIGSVDLGRDELLVFESMDYSCREGDLLVLCTDAVAEWGLKRQESGEPVDWRSYWDMGESTWREEIARRRSEQQMRYDDATLVLLRVCRQVPSSDAESGQSSMEPAAEPPPSAEDDDWEERLKHISGQVAEEMSSQIVRGVEKLKRFRNSARAAFKRYRDKLRDQP